MNSPSASRQIRSNVNAFTRPRVPAAVRDAAPTSLPANVNLIREREDVTTPDSEKIADLENLIEEYKEQLIHVCDAKRAAENRAETSKQELKRAREELVYLRGRLDTSQIDAKNGQLVVEEIPDRVDADMRRPFQGQKMEMEGRLEEMTSKCKELERKLKKSDESKVLCHQMLRNSNTELSLERAVSTKLRGELEKLKNCIENVLAESNVMRMNHQVNPASPCPSSASALNVTVGMIPSQEVDELNLPQSDIEELEEDEEKDSRENFMESLVNNIPEDKLAELGIFDDDD